MPIFGLNEDLGMEVGAIVLMGSEAVTPDDRFPFNICAIPSLELQSYVYFSRLRLCLFVLVVVIALQLSRLAIFSEFSCISLTSDPSAALLVLVLKIL